MRSRAVRGGSGAGAGMARDARRKSGNGRPRSVGAGLRSSPQVRRLYRREVGALDLYHTLLTVPWGGFFAALAVSYLIFNLAFGLCYLLVGGVANARPSSFADAFFFSIQTMATIGYGQFFPQSFAANLLVSVEVLLGMSGLALATGLIFARFSRPTARVLFSEVAVVTVHEGAPTLMFRAANQRRDQILEAQVSVSLLRDEQSAEGYPMRRFHDLALVRARTPMFLLTWTVMHRIDEKSPLFGATAQSLAAENVELVVTLIGLDASLSQTVHARYSYLADEIMWNRRFADILSFGTDGSRVVDYRRFHDLAETGQ